MLLFIVILASFETAGIASIMPFLAFLANPQGIVESYHVQQAWNFIFENEPISQTSVAVIFGMLSFVTLGITLLVRSITTYNLNIFIENNRHLVSTDLMGKFLNSSYSYVKNNNSSSVVKGMLSEVDAFSANVFRPFILMIAFGIVAGTVLSLLFWYNFLLTCTLAGVFIISYSLVYLLIRQRLNELGKKNVASNESRFKISAEVVSGIKAIKIQNAQKLFFDRFKFASTEFARSQASRQSLTLIPNDFIEFVAFGGAILAILAYLLLKGPANSFALTEVVAHLGIFGMAAYRLKPAAFNIFIGFSSLRYGGVIVNSLLRLQEGLQNHQEPSADDDLNITAAQVSLKNITFSHSGNKKIILENQSITIAKTEITGIIGASGSGKSTLVDILTGLLRSRNEQRLVDGSIISKYQFNSWRKLFGYVPQNVFVLDDTYYANVAFGEREENVDKQRVIEACKQARLHDFIIENHPSNYEVVLGEGGIRLSGGQRQRLGIARALYFKPQILVLDEGTSALDERVEYEILMTIKELKGKVAVLMITHKASTLDICSKVIRLENARLTEVSREEDGSWRL
jgi:ATP-binding cassette, subfamily B, bacterial PglK